MKEEILVVGGVHGNEEAGKKLYKKLSQEPITGVTPLMANYLACESKVGYIDTDLNKAFKGIGFPNSSKHEERLAFNLKSIVNREKYSFVIDVHSNNAENCTTAMVVGKINQKHLQVAEFFGFRRIISLPENMGFLIGVKKESAILFEISHEDRYKFSASKIHKKLKELVELGIENIHIPKKTKTTIYEYLSESKPKTVQEAVLNFTELSTAQKMELNLDLRQEFYPVFVGEESCNESFWIVRKALVY
jgi:succinylglutamate desuccinylase